MSNSQSEAGYKFVYNGSSMKPTFKPGQLLYIQPEARDVEIGDVIVYKGQIDSRNIVHRVVSVSANGFLTRGDNNKGLDPYLVERHQVLGKVERFEKQGKSKPVIGGQRGLWMAKAQWALLRLDVWFRKIFWKPYFLLRASGVVSRLWRPSISIMNLQTESGTLVKYIYKQRTVAVWDASQQKFDCRKPFDLVIPRPEGLQA